MGAVLVVLFLATGFSGMLNAMLGRDNWETVNRYLVYAALTEVGLAVVVAIVAIIKGRLG